MRIIRFQAPDGGVHFGTPSGSDQAERLVGDFEQGFSSSGETLQVARLLAPVTPPNIFCIGLNYRDHAEETGLEIPKSPVVFMKPTSALTDPGAPIRLPACCEHGPEVDYEGELVVVIGRAARNVSEAEALDHVFGYTIANDVSARKWQMHGGGGQWIRGKSFDSFCPVGPALLTADEIADPQALELVTRVNGEVVQDGHTEKMIFCVASLIRHLSRDLTLLPGTIILTGTPAGVGFGRKPPLYLSAGDTAEVTVEPIGTLSNPVADAG